MYWHSETSATVVAQLTTDPDHGLSDSEAASRLQQQGPNRLQEAPPRSAWRKLLDQFGSFLILLLLGAALLAGAVGNIKDALVIASVVLTNALLGFFQEYRAEAALAALKGMLAPVARVRRNGHSTQVDATTLVQGDLLLLEAGDRVPADARILAAYGAEVAEAALTGESQAVPKHSETVAADSVLADRSNMVYMNTVVTRGRIEAVVIATGMKTEMGRLAGMLAATSESATPLQIQLDHLGKRLAAMAGVVVGMIFLFGLLRGDDLITTAMTAIALAVAAIPEGLPAVVTVTLAVGMHRMAKRHAVVKKLAAVETLGCTTVICSDKTGTLTLNQMTARRLFYHGQCFTVTGEGYQAGGAISAAEGMQSTDFAPLLLPATLCADASIQDGQLIGDPTEGALLALAMKAGINISAAIARYPRIAEIPFDSTHKFMATFHRDGDRVLMCLKGAPDIVLSRASHYQAPEGAAPVDDAARDRFEAENAALAQQAMRVLALAEREIPARDFDPAGNLMPWTRDITLLGLVGIIDPPRPEVRTAIRTCQAAGVAVKMITGDHPVTASAIARDLGLAGEVHEGRELDGLTETELADLVLKSAVLARVAPEHKMRIVKALKSRGHVVAMTGDGVNDAPALKAADIGVAMGITGTEVTKEAATLVLTDDNFASIVRAVRDGRTIYDNIVKFVRFQLSTNIGAILTVLGAPLFGLPTPFTAIQILWVNIIMDGPPAMTLGVEPPRQDIMTQAPRRAEAAILTGSRLLQLGFFGLLMATGTLAAYSWGLRQGGAAYAGTMAFTTFVLFQFFNIFNARAEEVSTFNPQFFKNSKLWLALAAVMLSQLAVVHWSPAQMIFGTVDLSVDDWLRSAALAASVLVLEELRKLAKTLLTHHDQAPTP